MRGVARSRRRRLWAALCALLAPILFATAALATDTALRNGPGAPQDGRLSLGSLTVSTPELCALDYSLQVFTETGSGDDAFELQVFDEGALVQTLPLSAPADGAVHQLSGTLALTQPVSQHVPGVGVYLVDSGVVLDAVDPQPVTCGAVQIPTLDTLGAGILGALLVVSALVVLRRTRGALGS